MIADFGLRIKKEGPPEAGLRLPRKTGKPFSRFSVSHYLNDFVFLIV